MRRRRERGGGIVTAAVGSRLAAAAAGYAARGLHVYPLHDVVRGSCSCAWSDCRRPGKHPRVPKRCGGRGFHDATTDAAVVAQWWDRWPNANIGCSLEPSGLVVIDVDVHANTANGFASLREIEAARGPLPATVTARTGGGGRHSYFRRPAGPLRHLVLAPGVELLTSSATLAPSVTTGAYVFARRGLVAELPAWIAELARPLAPAPLPPGASLCGSRARAYVVTALRAECEAVAATPDGSGRNPRLCKAAYKIGGLLHLGLGDEEAAVALLAAARANGSPDVRSIDTIARGLRAGAASPRAVIQECAVR